jgi:hypothetical protein
LDCPERAESGDCFQLETGWEPSPSGDSLGLFITLLPEQRRVIEAWPALPAMSPG